MERRRLTIAEHVLVYLILPLPERIGTRVIEWYVAWRERREARD